MRTSRILVLAALLGLLLAGCFNPFDPRVSLQRAASTPAPFPSSPANAIRLFEWCWQNRDPQQYTEVFTDDYRFYFAPTDSAGNAYRDTPWIREAEMSMAQHLFQGGTDRPPASDITITLDANLVPQPDPRPGMGNLRFHRSIRTAVDLKVTVTQADGTPEVTPVQGHALFFLVRGDSAAIPPELVSKGFRPDSTRWWISRWEDETAGSSAPAAGVLPVGRIARPARVLPPMSWGQLKLIWN